MEWHLWLIFPKNKLLQVRNIINNKEKWFNIKGKPNSKRQVKETHKTWTGLLLPEEKNFVIYEFPVTLSKGAERNKFGNCFWRRVKEIAYFWCFAIYFTIFSFSYMIMRPQNAIFVAFCAKLLLFSRKTTKRKEGNVLRHYWPLARISALSRIMFTLPPFLLILQRIFIFSGWMAMDTFLCFSRTPFAL